MQSETMLKKYKFGFEPWGLFLFIIIMIPNFFWFIFPPREDVLRTDSATKIIDVIGSVFQALMIATLCTLKNKESKKIRLTPCIIITAICYLLYITGWIFYYCGITGKSIISVLTLAPCLAFLFFAIDRKNRIAIIPVSVFTLCHLVYGVVNFVIR